MDKEQDDKLIGAVTQRMLEAYELHKRAERWLKEVVRAFVALRISTAPEFIANPELGKDAPCVVKWADEDGFAEVITAGVFGIFDELDEVPKGERYAMLETKSTEWLAGATTHTADGQEEEP